ncbi:MAG: hypothetical protein VXW22_16125 [Pseudomonadota bacterium]|nr:hypothetical protein [Pseudomonadota bacterium]
MIVMTTPIRTVLLAGWSAAALAACAVTAPETAPEASPVIVDTAPVVVEADPPVIHKAEPAGPAASQQRSASQERALR